MRSDDRNYAGRGGVPFKIVLEWRSSRAASFDEPTSTASKHEPESTDDRRQLQKRLWHALTIASLSVARRDRPEGFSMNGLHPASDPMLAALHATAPSPVLADKLALFGQFIGSWDLQIVYYARDGSVARRMQGEWHFGWVLAGRAIQDVWIAPRRALRDPGKGGEEYGATLRFYDPELGAWRSTWIGPVKGAVKPFIARESEDEIILDGSFAQGIGTRWIFSRIEPDAFQWRAIESHDDWKTCHLEQQMFATRQPAAR